MLTLHGIPGRRLLLVLLTLTAGTVVNGQASRPIDLTGTWALDVHLSDHPEQIARALQLDAGEFAPDARGADPARGAGARVGSAGRSGNERHPSEDRMSPEEKKLLAEVTRVVQFAPPTLTIAQDDRAVTITGHATADVMRTDGKSEKRALETGTINRTAVWEGPLFRVAYDMGRVGILTYAYTIVPTTKQLLIRINIERLPGQPGPFDIKLVYNRTPNPAT